MHGGDGPVVLGLRVLALAAPAALDVTVPLAALLDRFPRARPPASAPPYPLARAARNGERGVGGGRAAAVRLGR